MKKKPTRFGSRLTDQNFVQLSLEDFKLLSQMQSHKDFSESEQRSLCEGSSETVSIAELKEKKQRQVTERLIIPPCGRIAEKSQESSALVNNKRKVAIFRSGYLHTKKVLNLPNPQKYELTEDQMISMRSINERAQKLFGLRKNHQVAARLDQSSFAEIVKICEDLLHGKNKSYLTIKNLVKVPQADIFKLFPSTQKIEKLIMPNNKQMEQQSQSRIQQQLEFLIINVIQYWKLSKVKFQYFPLVRKYWPRTQIASVNYNFDVPYKSRVWNFQTRNRIKSVIMKCKSVREQASKTFAIFDELNTLQKGFQKIAVGSVGDCQSFGDLIENQTEISMEQEEDHKSFSKSQQSEPQKALALQAQKETVKQQIKQISQFHQSFSIFAVKTTLAKRPLVLDSNCIKIKNRSSSKSYSNQQKRQDVSKNGSPNPYKRRLRSCKISNSHQKLRRRKFKHS